MRKYGEYEELVGILISFDSKVKQTIKLPVFCKYDLTKTLTHCPECNQKDRDLIIRHELYYVDFKKEHGYYYSGYCIVERCSATKKWLRCKYEF